MTSYNYGEFIGKAIDSVLVQSFKDFELIIVDDHSTDGSVEIIRHYAQSDPRVRFIEHTTNIGGTPSLIEACNLARGRYMVNIDSDDWIISRYAFQYQIDILERNPDVSFVFAPEAQFRNGSCSRLRAPADGDTIWPGHKAIEKVLDFFVTHTGTMLRTSSYIAVGGYNPEYRYTLDLKLWVDLCKVGRVAYIHQMLYAYRQHTNSMSNFSNPRLWQHEILKSVESAFTGSFSSSLINANSLYRQVVRQSLLAGPLHHVFSNNYKHGWQLYWVSLTMRPRDTLFQKQTLVIIGRTLLGEKMYRRIIGTSKSSSVLGLTKLRGTEFLQNGYAVAKSSRRKHPTLN